MASSHQPARRFRRAWLIGAVLLVLVVVAVAALPLATVGALGAMWLLGLTLNVCAFSGLIMLVGRVTKNAILLVDYTKRAGGARAPAGGRSRGGGAGAVSPRAHDRGLDRAGHLERGV